jgi:two-component system, sensor histidine kinase and response regulator
MEDGMTEALRVLVTDDEEGMRLGVTRALSGYVARFPELDAEVTYDIGAAESGEEALDRVAAERPDILLLDFKLPGISGMDVLGEVKRLEPPLLTVMITAYASLHTAVEATKSGAFDFLPKPFTPEELRAAVRKATRHLILQRQAQKLAAQQRRARFELTSVLAHELKAPLNAVEGYLATITEGAVSDAPTIQHVVSRSIVRVQGMRQLILDLLDLTRIEAGIVERTLVGVDLREAAEAAIEAAAPLTNAKGIAVELVGDSPLVVPAVRAELDIVFNNLISNAIKYNREHGKVSVSLSRRGESVEIAVSDTGIGLTQEEVGKLFREFVRIKGPRTRGIEGSGLGLSTVKKVAQLYQGDVSVKSRPDEGSTFTVTLQSPESGARGGVQ